MLTLWSSAAPAFRARAVQIAADHAETAPRSPDISAKSPVRRSEQSEAMPLDRPPFEKEPLQVNSFQDLPLVEPIRRALKEEGYTVPTPIQAQAIPQLLEGKDLLGIAQTGTGKTAAFALPILQRLAAEKPASTRRKTARVLVLTPTRELALQIGESF